MIRPRPKNISKTTQNRLNDLQKKVNAQATFQEKVAKAQSLWKSRSNSKIGKTAFEEVKETLIKMYISEEEVCPYCEHNEAGDIEHISPKSFFPNKTFKWKNYLFACKQCNTGYKLDKCFVLTPSGDIIAVERGKKPPYQTTAFINPRIENPTDFLILNLEDFKFELMPGLNKKDKNKAEKTCEILQLNNRGILVKGRERAAEAYYEKIERLVKILNSNTLSDLQSNLLKPFDRRFDFTQDLATIKSEIKASYKHKIQIYPHPSVWYAIKKVSSVTDDDWKKLFAQIPEALTW